MDLGYKSHLSDKEFRRLVGVERRTFSAMLDCLSETEAVRQSKHKYRGGRRPKLSLEQRLAMTLEYLREYRTQFHIGQSYGVSESSANRIIVHTENVLMKSGLFSLPGKKSLVNGNISYSLVSVDATETPCERPKKDKNASIQARKSDIR